MIRLISAFRCSLSMLLVSCVQPVIAQQSESIERGATLFARYGCYQCHQYSGAGFQGAPGGALLTPLRFPEPAFIAYIRNPSQPTRMPPYTEKVLSEEEARAIYAYIAALPQPKAKEDIELLNNLVKEMQQ